ncbi:helix-turn-helix domain-containing protein [Chryseobacterium sp. POL2]|uniref:helix-turn-helix domain-containing protein n=1 Tax=Chryseobacterium sp. POL2 TaxID=2713414 RepID=UPI0013E17BAC|nr:helix-turn-helix domain-containing protein [Chryseobacterium sp. POL2]QIG89337.1 helix-turn-helix domain-containing protein [Chryseobacterium sp. POL2]
MKNINIDYKRIFADILEYKFPQKIEDCLPLLQKGNLTSIDIIKINKQIFGVDKETELYSQKHRSYGKSDILKILDYQKKHKLNNSQLAIHFSLSRNTVAKWKKMFVV